MDIKEIIARVICEFDGGDPDYGAGDDGIVWTWYVDQAEASLHALQEAGYVVVPRKSVPLNVSMAGQKALRRTDQLATSRNLDRWKYVPIAAMIPVYQAMIEAQLSDQAMIAAAQEKE